MILDLTRQFIYHFNWHLFVLNAEFPTGWMIIHSYHLFASSKVFQMSKTSQFHYKLNFHYLHEQTSCLISNLYETKEHLYHCYFEQKCWIQSESCVHYCPLFYYFHSIMISTKFLKKLDSHLNIHFIHSW
jgi:hypothetical protein